MRFLPPSFAKVLVGLLTISALTMLIAGVALITSPETYTIYDGETAIPVTGSFSTIEEVLRAAEITVRPEDLVTPEITGAATADVPVHIQRAVPVTLQMGNETRTLWTSELTLGAFLQEVGIPLNGGQQVYADGILIPDSFLGHTALPNTVEIGSFLTLTIHDGSRRQVIRSSARTVGQALEEAGIQLNPADDVLPDPMDQLVPNMVITIRRSFLLTIRDRGNSTQIHSHRTDVTGVLADAGIELAGDDFTIPGNDALLKANDVIDIIRVTEDFRTVDEEMPYQTLWQATDELAIDTQAILVQGESGIRRRRIRVRYENGIEVGQTDDGEWVAREPVDQVIGYGTRIELTPIDTPDGPREYWRVVRMRVTSYTAASSGKDPDDPDYGRTASGVPAGFGVVAIDRNVVPFRSYVYVPGYGIGFAGDTGGGIRGRWIDLGYDANNYVSWSGYVDVYYLAPVPPPEDINYLLPAMPP